MQSGLLFRGSVALAILAGWLVACPVFVHDPALTQVLAWLGFIATLQAAPALMTPRPDLFSPPVFFGVTAAFGTVSSIVYMAEPGELRIPLLGSVTPDDDLAAAYRTVAGLILGLAAYYFGYYSRIGPRFRRWLPRVGGLVWRRERILAFSIVLGILFAGAYATFHVRVGTSVFAILDQAAGKAAWHDDPTLSWMLRGVQLGFIPVLLFIVHTVSGGVPWRKLVLPVALLGVMMLLVSRLGGRGMWASALLTAFALFHYLRRRIPVVGFVAIYFVGIVVANVFLQYRNEPEQQRSIPTASEIVSRPSSVLQAHEAERMRFETLAVVMQQFPENEPYLVGKSWVPLLLAPIPRWLWPDKLKYVEDQDNGLVYRISGVPAPTPFVGILYANLSWLGIVLGMMGYGLFHRALYEWLRDSPRDKSVVLLYVLILMYFYPTALGISGAFQYVVPVWVIVRLAGRRPDPVSAPAPA